MSPRAIAQRVAESGLQGFAVCDHNSAENCPALWLAARELGLGFISGIEVTTREEAHVLVLFDDPWVARGFGRWLYQFLPNFKNDPERFGDQVIVSLEEQILGEVDKFLAGATSLALGKLTRVAKQVGALVIPAHLDKPMFSVVSQLGMMPVALAVDAVEITGFCDEQLASRYAAGRPVIHNSDAHYLDDIAKFSTNFPIQELTVPALRTHLKKLATTS